MGVYVFRSLVSDWIKIGHYKGTNAWSRVAHRGFRSCVCPHDIGTRTTATDLELIAWFPSLTTRDESACKSRWKHDRVGEWLPASKTQDVLDFLESVACHASLHHTCSLSEAMATRKRL